MNCNLSNFIIKLKSEIIQDPTANFYIILNFLITQSLKENQAPYTMSITEGKITYLDTFFMFNKKATIMHICTGTMQLKNTTCNIFALRAMDIR